MNELIFFTIGVYQSTEEAFFEQLIAHQIDLFCDIRRRRGVRGAKYAFVNSKRLQSKLKALEIGYKHILDLAPTKDIRNLQKEADKKQSIKKRDRSILGEVFEVAYKEDILNAFDFNEFITELNQLQATRVVFFCVEEHHLACHRSVVTKEIAEQYECTIIHL